jgi:hypothetical protein
MHVPTTAAWLFYYAISTDTQLKNSCHSSASQNAEYLDIQNLPHVLYGRENWFLYFEVTTRVTKVHRKIYGLKKMKVKVK